MQAQSRAGRCPCSTIIKGDVVAEGLTSALLCSSEDDGQSLQQKALAALLAGKLDAPLLFQAGKALAAGWLQKQVKGKGSLLDTSKADFVVPKVTGCHAAISSVHHLAQLPDQPNCTAGHSCAQLWHSARQHCTICSRDLFKIYKRRCQLGRFFLSSGTNCCILLLHSQAACLSGVSFACCRPSRILMCFQASITGAGSVTAATLGGASQCCCTQQLTLWRSATCLQYAPATCIATGPSCCRLLSSFLLHDSFLHLVLNSAALFQLAPEAEAVLGYPTFAAVYLLSGLGASLATIAFSDTISVGASACIFGLIGAMAGYLWRNRSVHQGSSWAWWQQCAHSTCWQAPITARLWRTWVRACHCCWHASAVNQCIMPPLSAALHYKRQAH